MTTAHWSPRGGVRVVVLAIIALAIVAAVVVAWWRPLVYGTAAPPEIPAVLTPPLARRLAERTSAVEDDPYSAEAWGALGAVYDVHDLFEEAIVCYARAETLDDDDFRWPYFGGMCTVVGNQEDALALFQRAAALRDDYAPLQVPLARGFFFAGDLDAAAEHFAHAARLDPVLIRPHLGLARVALARGDASAALEHLGHAAALGPTAGEVDGLLSEAHRRAGNLDAAELHLARSSERAEFEPLPDTLRQELGFREGATLIWTERRSAAYLAAGDTARAIAEWERAVQDDPESGRASHALAVLYRDAGRSEDAVKAFERALAIDPDDATTRADLVLLYIMRGQVDVALEHARSAAERAPRNAESQFLLGMALRANRQPGPAVEAFDAALTLDPDHSRARFVRAAALASAGNLEASIDAFRDVIAREPGEIGAYTILARVLERSGRPADALDALRQGLLANPTDPRVMMAVAWSLATSSNESLRDGEEARRLVAPLAESMQPPDPKVLDTLAAAYAELGRYDEAIQVLLVARNVLTPADEQLGEAIEARLGLYRAGRPYRE